nr:hypothetical protein [Gammaproteobacteria bacterium]
MASPDNKVRSVRKVGESLLLERRETVEKRLWDMFSGIPEDVRLADELIAERREAARREMSEING